MMLKMRQSEPSELVAVGTPIARRPPHRSQRAELPHWAHIIEANGASYRLEQSRKRLARQKKISSQD